jgi:transcriptional regulator with XRE-family HTH domain
MKKVHAQIAKKIKAELKRKGLTAEKLSYETGAVSKGYLYGYLSGKPKYQNISLNTLYEIAKALEVPIKKLLPD